LEPSFPINYARNITTTRERVEREREGVRDKDWRGAVETLYVITDKATYFYFFLNVVTPPTD